MLPNVGDILTLTAGRCCESNHQSPSLLISVYVASADEGEGSL